MEFYFGSRPGRLLSIAMLLTFCRLSHSAIVEPNQLNENQSSVLISSRIDYVDVSSPSSLVRFPPELAENVVRAELEQYLRRVKYGDYHVIDVSCVNSVGYEFTCTTKYHVNLTKSVNHVPKRQKRSVVAEPMDMFDIHKRLVLKNSKIAENSRGIAIESNLTLALTKTNHTPKGIFDIFNRLMSNDVHLNKADRNVSVQSNLTAKEVIAPLNTKSKRSPNLQPSLYNLPVNSGTDTISGNPSPNSASLPLSMLDLLKGLVSSNITLNESLKDVTPASNVSATEEITQPPTAPPTQTTPSVTVFSPTTQLIHTVTEDTTVKPTDYPKNLLDILKSLVAPNVTLDESLATATPASNVPVAEKITKPPVISTRSEKSKATAEPKTATESTTTAEPTTTAESTTTTAQTTTTIFLVDRVTEPLSCPHHNITAYVKPGRYTAEVQLHGGYVAGFPPGVYPFKDPSSNMCNYYVHVLNSPVIRTAVFRSKYDVRCDAISDSVSRAFLQSVIKHRAQQLQGICHDDCSTSKQQPWYACNDDLLTIDWPTDRKYSIDTMEPPLLFSQSLRKRMSTAVFRYSEITILTRSPPVVLAKVNDKGEHIEVVLVSSCSDDKLIYDADQDICM